MRESLNINPGAIARNAISGYVALILSSLLGFVVTPVLLTHLGTTGFGVWSLILGTVAYLSLLEAGLGFATTTRIAANEALGPRALSRVVSTSVVLCLGMAACGVVLTVALAALFPVLFDVPPRLMEEARVALLLAGIAQATTFVTLIFTASLLGTGRMYIVNFAGFVVSALTSISQVVLVLLGGGLAGLAGIQLIGAIAVLMVFRTRARVALPDVVVRFGSFDRPTARHLLSLGWRNGVYAVASVLAFGSDVVLVGLLLGARVAAGYAIALRVYTFLQLAASGVLGAVGPTHAHAAQHKSPEWRFQLFCIASYATLSLAVCAGVVVGLFAPSLLHLWLGRVPAGTSLILRLLCLVLILQAPGMSSASLLLNSERAGELMRITVTSASLNVVASVLFTITIGNIGPALGSLVAVALVDAVYLPRRVCRVLGQPYRAWMRGAVAPLLGPLVVLIVVLAFGHAVLPGGAWVLAIAACAVLAYLATLWFLPTGRRLWGLLAHRELAPA